MMCPAVPCAVKLPEALMAIHVHDWHPEPVAIGASGDCPACGDPIDYCRGHGEIGDPKGFAILEDHDAGEHSGCNPNGCDVIHDRAAESWDRAMAPY